MSNADLIRRLRAVRIDQSESVPRLRHEAAAALEAAEARIKELEGLTDDLGADVITFMTKRNDAIARAEAAEAALKRTADAFENYCNDVGNSSNSYQRDVIAAARATLEEAKP